MFFKARWKMVTDYVNLDKVKYLTVRKDPESGKWGVFAYFSYIAVGVTDNIAVYASNTREGAEAFAHSITLKAAGEKGSKPNIEKG